MSIQDHTLYLHKEANGYSVRFKIGPGLHDWTRYVFSNGERLLDFVIQNYLDSKVPSTNDPINTTEPAWIIAQDPYTVRIEEKS